MQRQRQSELRAALRERFPRQRGQLLPALHFLQHEFGHLPDWAMEVVGWYLGVPVSEVYGAATSYTELRLEGAGECLVRVCTGITCWMSGSSGLLETIASWLRKNPGGGVATVEEAACGFLCAMAPAVEVDGRWVGRATPEAVNELLPGSALP